MINILFIGDVFGRPGRRVVRELLPALVNRHVIDLVVANGENAAGGMGLTIKAAQELFASGVDVLTSGNHIFKHKEINEYLDREKMVLRPANYPDPAPGRGARVVELRTGVPVGVINVMGRVFMAPLDCPFQAVDREISRLRAEGARMVLVDFHAEATSEKKAMGWHLAGRVGAVIGTHTHVQTADEAILPGGTAYLTDAGMTGPHSSVIGVKKEAVLERFLSGRPVRFEAAKRGLRLEGAVISLAADTGLATNILRIQQILE